MNNPNQRVSTLWNFFTNSGSMVRRFGQGRIRITPASHDRDLTITVRRNRMSIAPQLSSELAAAIRTLVSRQTVYRRLNENGVGVYFTGKGVYFTVFTTNEEYLSLLQRMSEQG